MCFHVPIVDYYNSALLTEWYTHKEHIEPKHKTMVLIHVRDKHKTNKHGGQIRDGIMIIGVKVNKTLIVKL